MDEQLLEPILPQIDPALVLNSPARPVWLQDRRSSWVISGCAV